MNHAGTQRLETSRLILRRFTVEDAPRMFAEWANDPEVTRYLTWAPHETPSVTRQLLEEWTGQYGCPEYYHWAIEEKQSGRLIGDIGVVHLSERDFCCEIGYCLSRDRWGLGIMTEAFSAVLAFLFDTVGVHRVEARHIAENISSGKVMQKCGLLREGVGREAFCCPSDGEYHDLVQYAILLEDWQTARPESRCENWNT